MHKLRDFKIWHKAVDLSELVYNTTACFPKEEQYNLTNQMRRSVVSIASNIAEGAGRNTDKELNHFLGMATGSAYKLYTQVVLAQRLAFVNILDYSLLSDQVEELLKMIYSFRQTIKNRIK